MIRVKIRLKNQIISFAHRYTLIKIRAAAADMVIHIIIRQKMITIKTTNKSIFYQVFNYFTVHSSRISDLKICIQIQANVFTEREKQRNNSPVFKDIN